MGKMLDLPIVPPHNEGALNQGHDRFHFDQPLRHHLRLFW